MKEKVILCLRWIFFLPVSLLGGILGGVIFGGATASFTDSVLLGWFVNGVATVSGGIYLAYEIAPKRTLRVETLVCGLYVLLGVLSIAAGIYLAIHPTGDNDPSQNLVIGIAMLLLSTKELIKHLKDGRANREPRGINSCERDRHHLSGLQAAVKGDLFTFCRWVLFLPIALIAGATVGNIAELTAGIAKELPFIGWIISGGGTVIAGVWVAGKVAPRQNHLTDLLVSLTFILEGVATIGMSPSLMEYENPWGNSMHYLIRGSCTIAGALAFYIFSNMERRAMRREELQGKSLEKLPGPPDDREISFHA